MNDATWQLVKRVFWDAQELPAADREEFAREACAGDDEALRDVLAMLAGEAAAESSFLESPLPASTKDLNLPALPRTLDDFELTEELGRGGMGVVYRARQISLDREVAVKILPADFTLDERLVERFQREARAVGKLRHAGIVPVYTEGQVGHEHYFAMELVEGHDLYHELRRLHGQENGEHFLPAADSHEYLTAVVHLVYKVARSLAYAHAHGVVHRDVKPRNLILERPEPGTMPSAQVLDFGLARDTAQGLHSLTHEIAGTPHYMSPEQIEAKRAKVDERTDLYSLGVVLYELLTHTHPFQGTTNLEVMRQISQREPPTARSVNPRVPRDLDTICLKAMEKSPEDRYASMEAFADDLWRFLNHEAVEAARPSLKARAARHLRRHRRSYAAATIGALLLAVLVVGAWCISRVAQVEALHATLRGQPTVPVSELSTTACLQLQRNANDLLELVDGDSEPAAEAIRVLALLNEHIDERVQAGRALIELEVDPPGDRSTVPLNEGRFHEGLGQLRRASALRPHDAQLAAESRAAFYDPRVEIVLDGELRAAVEAGRLRVLYAPHGWEGVGAMNVLAGWRDGPVALPAGDYRFRFELEGEGIAESLRWLRDRGFTYQLRPRVLVHEDVVSDMVHIPAGAATVGMVDDPRFTWHRMREKFVEEFWIDRVEMSNGRYRDFLLATDRPAHHLWYLPGETVPTFELPDEWLDLPVIGVRWFDAVACAEWYGKRLPTWFEWQKAAAGVDAWTVPWAAEFSGTEELMQNVILGHEMQAGETEWGSYLRHVSPGARNTGDITPTGLLHMLGNVFEWTENSLIFGYEGRPLASSVSRVIGGRDWRSLAYDGGDLLHAMGTQTYHSSRAGFRCVRGTPKPNDR